MRLHPFRAVFAVAVALGLWGCSDVIQPDRVHRMGELATVGPVIYNVLETEWRAGIGESLQQKVPEEKFLLIRLTATNSSDRDVAIPLLTLENEAGDSFLEESEIEGLPSWLGLLRIVQPAGTLQGQIVFDVPVGDYKLRVTDGGELESERTALVEIPLSFGAPDPLQQEPLGQ
jgi:hypothetical protein